MAHSEDTTGCELDSFADPKKIFQDHPTIQYFLSKHPDAISNGIGIEHGSLGYASFVYEADSSHAELTVYFDECYVPLQYSFYHDANEEWSILTDAKLNEGATVEQYTENKIIEILKDEFLSSTHQKWLNLRGQIVYILPVSVDTLIERSYLTEKIEFFDFDQLRIP